MLTNNSYTEYRIQEWTTNGWRDTFYDAKPTLVLARQLAETIVTCRKPGELFRIVQVTTKVKSVQ